MKSSKYLNQFIIKQFNSINNYNRLLIGSQNLIKQQRYYCDKKLNNQDKFKFIMKSMTNMEHINYVSSFGLPRLSNRIFSEFYLKMKMPSIDPNFDKEQFLSNCKEATIVFCNLVSNNEAEKCEELMTPSAYQDLIDKYKDATEDDFEQLKVTEDDIKFTNLIFLEDFKKDEKHYVQATYTVLKKTHVEELQDQISLSDLVIVKFLRDYTKGKDSNEPWLISYFDHRFLKRSNIFKSYEV